MYNLLDEALLRVRSDTGTEKMNLPQVLEALGNNAIRSFSGLQSYQTHAWHAFLVQLAAIALSKAKRGLDSIPTASQWRELIINITPNDCPEVWTLVVEDLNKPALLQPPVNGLNLQHYKTLTTPDQLDVLVLSKNHDVKCGRQKDPDVDQWIYALVMLQTMQGFLGAGNYGVSRMYKGFGSRAAVGYSDTLDYGTKFKNHLQILLQNRDEIRELGLNGDVALVWCVPWEENEQLQLSMLDPFYIEICRRVRFTICEKSLQAHMGTSRTYRINAMELKGNVCDPWIPVHEDKQSALTMTKSGFTYDRTQELLFGQEYISPICLELPKNKEMFFCGQVLCRGQGQTAGYHERILKISKEIGRRLSNPEEKKSLSKKAKLRVTAVRDFKNKILTPALLQLSQGGPEKANFDDKSVETYMQQVDRMVDRDFFQELFKDADTPEDEALGNWQSYLKELGEAIMEKARTHLVKSSALKYKAIAKADSYFYGSLAKNFTEMKG